MAEPVDYVAWHRAYDDPASGLSWRLRTVQGWLRQALDERPGPVTLISVCAGEGRDVLGVLSEREDHGRVSATLLEADPRIVHTARSTAADAGLTTAEVRRADAGHTDAYRGLAPADVVLLVGIFGNVSTEDIRRTVAWSPHLCAPGALLLWSRGRDRGDLNPQIRRWFAAAGFLERDYQELDRDELPAAGAMTYTGGVPITPIEGRLFEFLP